VSSLGARLFSSTLTERFRCLYSHGTLHMHMAALTKLSLSGRSGYPNHMAQRLVKRRK
jgi:hypothetical protein